MRQAIKSFSGILARIIDGKILQNERKKDEQVTRRIQVLLRKRDELAKAADICTCSDISFKFYEVLKHPHSETRSKR